MWQVIDPALSQLREDLLLLLLPDIVEDLTQGSTIIYSSVSTSFIHMRSNSHPREQPDQTANKSEGVFMKE